jgi:hypothetical protein
MRNGRMIKGEWVEGNIVMSSQNILDPPPLTTQM